MGGEAKKKILRKGKLFSVGRGVSFSDQNIDPCLLLKLK
jgi:hypothetical protein